MITTEQLRKLGFVTSPSIGTKPFPHTLRWRGAPLFWVGGKLMHKGQAVPVETIDDVAAFIKSLNIKPKTGIKAL